MPAGYRDLGVLPAMDMTKRRELVLPQMQFGGDDSVATGAAQGYKLSDADMPPDDMDFADFPAQDNTTPPPLPGVDVPVQSDSVRAYLKSKVGQPDPKLLQAEQEEARNRALSNVGRALGGIGDAYVRGAQGFANVIAGNGYTTAPAGSTLTPFKTEDDSPVQRYLAARKAETDDAKARLDTARADALENPDSLGGQKLELAKEEAKRRLEQGDRKLGLDAAKDKESARRNAVLEDIQKQRMALQKQLQGARDDMTKQRLGVMLKRLGIQEEKLGNDEGAGVVSLADSQDRYLPKPEAAQLNDRAQSAQSVLGTLSKLQKLEEDHRLGLLTPDEASAQAQTLLAELGPQWNAAQTKLGYSGSRAQAIQHALTDPRSAEGLIKDMLSGGTYTKTNLRTARDLIMESLQHQGEARGVHFGDVGPDTKSKPTHVRSAAPGRPGSGSGPGEGYPRIQKKDAKGNVIGTYEKRPDGWYEVDG